METGIFLTGGQKVAFRRLYSDLPCLVRPGTVLAEAPEGERAGTSAVLPHPVFVIYPGPKGEYELYEDDGSSVAYERGECVRTRIRHWSEGHLRIVEIAPAEGSCEGWQEERPVTLKLCGYVPPVSVKADGKEIPWSYDGGELTCSISLPLMKTREGVRLEIEFAEEDEYASLAGWRGAVRRLRLLADILMRRDDRFRVWDGDGMMNKVRSSDDASPKPASATPTKGSGTWICRSCGNESRSKKFCENCGAIKPSEDAVCAGCGKTYVAEKKPKFCENCGKPMS